MWYSPYPPESQDEFEQQPAKLGPFLGYRREYEAILVIAFSLNLTYWFFQLLFNTHVGQRFQRRVAPAFDRFEIIMVDSFQRLRTRLMQTTAFQQFETKFVDSVLRPLVRSLILIRSRLRPHLGHFRALLAVANFVAIYSPKFPQFQLTPKWLWICELLAGETWFYLAMVVPVIPFLDWSFEHPLSFMPLQWKDCITFVSQMASGLMRMLISCIICHPEIIAFGREVRRDQIREFHNDVPEAELERQLVEHDKYWETRRFDLILVGIHGLIELVGALTVAGPGHITVNDVRTGLHIIGGLLTSTRRTSNFEAMKENKEY